MEGLMGEVVMSLDGGGAKDGRTTGMSVGGTAAEARECRNAMDSSFFARRGCVGLS